jgi:adhesin transport system membrane fusion protein
VIRLKRELAELELKKVETTAQYLVQAREELAKANADIASLSSVIDGRNDSLARLTIRSPVRGIVKNIEVSTIGGVVPPNGKLMDIIPLGDQLLIEARISPRDIAFIHPDQNATVKITAYDYAVYGALEGKVTTISPDTILDEADPKNHYYRVFVKSESDALVNKAGRRFPIAPGMIATVDIHTGEKTVLDYLIKPFNKAQEAMRER